MRFRLRTFMLVTTLIVPIIHGMWIYTGTTKATLTGLAKVFSIHESHPTNLEFLRKTAGGN